MNKYVASVLGGGFCWGFMGFFTRHLAEYGIDANGAIVVRCGIAALCFAVLILCTGTQQFRIRLKDLWCFLGTGVVSCFVPYMLYTYGLTGLENGRASILASVEPVVASLIGVFIYHEKMTIPAAAGVILVLLAILLLNLNPHKKEPAAAD